MRSVIPFGMSDKTLKCRLSVLAIFVACIPVRAYADTVDTFNFTQGGYQAGGTLTGTFAGTVEPSGLIEAKDLTNFFAVFMPGPFEYELIVPLPSGGGPFFSYDVNGGNSTLDFIAAGQAPTDLCVGAAPPLACGSMPSSFGIVVNFAQTSEQPIVTLVSSVTTSPVPEPLSAALIGVGFVAAAFFLRFRHQRRGSRGPT
jgi:hypothetical protein